MSAPSVHQGDHVFTGAVQFAGGITFPKTTREEAVHLPKAYAAGKSSDAPVTEKRFLHRAVFDGVLNWFGALMIGTVITGTSTVTVDLLKNGVTILTAVVTLDVANVLRTIEYAAGYTAGVAYAAGDVFEVNIVATVGTGGVGTGLVCQGDFIE